MRTRRILKFKTPLYHVPPDDFWDAPFLAQALLRRGLEARLFSGAVVITIAPAQPSSVLGHLVHQLTRPASHTIRISYCPEHFLCNIILSYDFTKVSTDDASFHAITEAVHERGYLAASDRDIAARYCPNSPELARLFDSIDDLKRQRSDLVAEMNFEQAFKLQKRMDSILKQVDTHLFAEVGRSKSADRTE